ncbi:preprotein translocase subunit SecE [Nosocomiicoccus ampullae]|uniref:preprotein translocase subunit SecE n=1 Tax=Nosocomiicoccus ampullae TaxID=489910 RepID=UPI001C5DFD1C|nr:preprotein translocase subunit SecE [Nosocomiicoccus ampullae]QYA48346.1 preprotein translocase subunit SecE [Nosocomiicoccus ampullae]
MNNDRNFLSNVVSEMKKVSWPTGKEVVNYTMIVVFTVIFFLFFFYAIDLGITYLIEVL